MTPVFAPSPDCARASGASSTAIPVAVISTAPASSRQLGSMVSTRIGRQGINLVDPTLVPLVRYKIAYREVGAVIYVERLWNNLLTSQALTFNLFGPFKQDLALATAVMRRLAPDLVGEDHRCALRALARPWPAAFHRRSHRLRRAAPLHHATGPQRLYRIEVKYSETPAGSPQPPGPATNPVARTPASSGMRMRQRCAMRRSSSSGVNSCSSPPARAGALSGGRLLVIAPAANTECQTAIARYRAELRSNNTAETRFQALTLEDLVTAVGSAGADTLAGRLTSVISTSIRFTAPWPRPSRRQPLADPRRLPRSHPTQTRLAAPSEPPRKFSCLTTTLRRIVGVA